MGGHPAQTLPTTVPHNGSPRPAHNSCGHPLYWHLSWFAPERSTNFPTHWEPCSPRWLSYAEFAADAAVMPGKAWPLRSWSRLSSLPPACRFQPRRCRTSPSDSPARRAIAAVQRPRCAGAIAAATRLASGWPGPARTASARRRTLWPRRGRWAWTSANGCPARAAASRLWRAPAARSGLRRRPRSRAAATTSRPSQSSRSKPHVGHRRAPWRRPCPLPVTLWPGGRCSAAASRSTPSRPCRC